MAPASVLYGRLSHQFGKHPGKIIGVFDAQLIGDLFYPQLGIQEVLAGLLYLQMIEIFDGGKTRLFSEEGRVMRGGKVYGLRDVLQCQELRYVGLHKIDRQLHGIVRLSVAGQIEFICINKRRDIMIETDIGVANIITAVTSFETGVHVLEQFDATGLEFYRSLMIVYLLN